MKFDNLANSILNEDESLDKWHQAQMDKEEDGMDPLTDPMFQKVMDMLEDLQVRSPDKFERFVTRLNDLVDFKKGVSL